MLSKRTFAEFQSGNVLLFSNPTLTKDTAITQWEEYKRIVDVTCPFDEETERNKWNKRAQALDEVSVFIQGCDNKKMSERLNEMYSRDDRTTYPQTIEAAVTLFNNKYPVTIQKRQQHNSHDTETSHQASPEAAQEGDLMAVHTATETVEDEDHVETETPTETTVDEAGTNETNATNAETIALLARPASEFESLDTDDISLKTVDDEDSDDENNAYGLICFMSDNPGTVEDDYPIKVEAPVIASPDTKQDLDDHKADERIAPVPADNFAGGFQFSSRERRFLLGRKSISSLLIGSSDFRQGEAE